MEKQIKKDNTHTNIICKKCQKAVVEYDSIQVRYDFFFLNKIHIKYLISLNENERTCRVCSQTLCPWATTDVVVFLNVD